MNYFDNGQFATCYELAGQGMPVVFVHGVGAHLQGWDGVIKAFKGSVRSLRYDLRGHGESERIQGPYQLQAFVDDLQALVTEQGWSRFHLVGFSLGGLIAQAYALQHSRQLHSLTIISSVTDRTPEEQAKVTMRADTLAEGRADKHMAAAVNRWFSDRFIEDHPEIVECRVQRSLNNDPHCYAAAYRVLAESDLADQLPGITCPTLIMTGEEDAGSTPRMAKVMSQRIPDAEVHILPGLKHGVLLEAPDLIAGIMLEFYRRRFNHSLMSGSNPVSNKLMEQGLKVRKEVLGEAYVEAAFDNADDFNCEFQHLVSEYCWGVCWTDDTLNRRERSILNLGMIAALGKSHEFELHFRGALRNGLNPDELKSVLTQIAVYCGIPAGVECFRIARKVLAEESASH
ncbi:alpha/beta fold hydrolase [Aliamphritea hakodatensis]|uniref:alpha/beta fold hydrolase n=1 Tax=Aliamphritea hakodatensis TaxID=2895352 RepID=UPI0022FD76CD|nr:alpha/beta fold hydrolase [Aliamphritea hakodatensis]